MATQPHTRQDGLGTLLQYLRQLIAEKRSVTSQTPPSRGSLRALSAGRALYQNDALLEAGQRVLSAPASYPEDSALELFVAYVDVIEASTEPAAIRAVPPESASLDIRLLDQIAELLGRFQEQGILDRGLPLQQAAFVLYSIFVVELLVYGQDDALEPRDIREALRKSVTTLFRNWVNW